MLRIKLCLVFIVLILLPLFNMSARENVFQKKNIKIGLIGKSKSNPVFIAAYAGARVAAQELGNKMGVEVSIEWKTPEIEDANKQSEAIESLIKLGVAGIAISCSDASTVTPSINKAVEMNIPVVCFDSDAPKSKRFAYYSINNETMGKMMMAEMAALLVEKGTIAILGGNKNAPNLQARINAVINELNNYPQIKLAENGVVYNEEVPEKAAEIVNKVQTSLPGIDGWIFVGGWPLFIKNALKWSPGKVKIVACDALPSELDYLENGYVQVLLAQHCFLWGYKSVELLLDKIVLDQMPKETFVEAPITRVTRENLEKWSMNWKKWLLKEAVYK